MEKKVVLITGGSSGIGKAIGRFLKAKGFVVYGTTRNISKHPDFSDFELIELNVTDTASIKNATEQVIGKEGRLDILVNNAGVGITGAIEETPDDEIAKAFNTNFNGPIRVMKQVMPHMRAQGGGVIINITSIAGYMGLPFRGIYSATKGALTLVSEAMRMEAKDFNIKIVCLAPGDFATNIAAGRYHAPVVEGSPYEETYSRILEDIDKDVDSGEDPIEVAKAVYNIVERSNPRPQVLVGKRMQKLSVALKRLLPQKWFEKLMCNHYRL